MARRKRSNLRIVPRKRNPRRRKNPVATRSNPGGISGIVISGGWIYVGMWLGGILGGFIPNIGGSGLVGTLLNGFIRAYAVAWVGGRFTRNAGLMAAGAFAPTVGSLLGPVLGGASGAIGSLTSGISGAIGGVKKPVVTSPTPPSNANTVIIPQRAA